MCGRFTFYTPPETLIARFFPDGLDIDTHVEASYNIPPGTAISMIRMSMNGQPILVKSLWGFRPAWATDKAPAPINARAETVATSRYFQEAFAHHRCLIPANGWYEWLQTGHGKEPHYVTPVDPDQTPAIFFAGIWTPREGDETSTCAIITEPACDTLKHIHDRQPVVLDPDCLTGWLDSSTTSREAIRATTHRLPMEQLREYRVSDAVNSPRHDSDDLIKPRGEQAS
ncbi:SOS response-associated peptidase [Marinobacter sp. chi1]|uniref:Abasic site processing protein n=1 Tax=Marinobacter suaedae TaxID=3057675 RepID=A0ABT8W3P6_9GAMM|nr:SOS response-associated peptidase [Marinobacter sp. chi1]MDO3722870.1 SOS response-associated peptidase [Marinobacter sp. chi1]